MSQKKKGDVNSEGVGGRERMESRKKGRMRKTVSKTMDRPKVEISFGSRIEKGWDGRRKVPVRTV